MDLDEFRKLSETANEATKQENADYYGVMMLHPDVVKIADALNYAAGEIERLQAVAALKSSDHARAVKEVISLRAGQCAGKELGGASSVLSEIEALRAQAVIDKGEIATLRSMVPTLRDGDAKPTETAAGSRERVISTLRSGIASAIQMLDEAEDKGVILDAAEHLRGLLR
jgi:hypothetical protein